MVPAGDPAPRTSIDSAASPSRTPPRLGDPAPSVVRLDGNFARRRFSPATTDRVFVDSELPGFGLRVRKGGGIGTWFVMVHRRGRRSRVTLGRADIVSASAARTAARKVLAAAVLDGLPTPPPKPDRITMAAFAVEFLRDYGVHWKPMTQLTSARIMRRELLPTFGTRAVGELARADIIRWRDSLAGPREAVLNRAVPVLSVMLQYAEQLGYRKTGSNPCRGIPRYKRELPERYLSRAEYRLLGQVLANEQESYPDKVAAVRLLLFTGARSGEIETLRWGWVKPDRLALPDSKTGAKTVFLNAPARAVIAGLKRGQSTALVFPSNRAATPINLGPFWTRVRKKCAMPDVRLHDLRHSFASVAITDQVPLATIGALLGHLLPETTARYAHLADDTIADAAQRVSGSLARCLGLAS